MKFEVLKEKFSVYYINKRMSIGIKTVSDSVSKSSHYTNDGEPRYGIDVHPVIKKSLK